MEDIPNVLVINWDHTGINYVSVNEAVKDCIFKIGILHRRAITWMVQWPTS